MDEARAVLERLERIDALLAGNAGRAQVLLELRALLEEAERWASAEGGEEGERAVATLRAALERDPAAREMIAV